MDFTLAETTLRDVVAPVVTMLERAGSAPGRLMLLGAVCRDVLHQAGGHTSSLRRTGDLDLALAVDDWAVYRDLTARFEEIRVGTRIRFLIAGLPVDLVPFGDVEDPDGQVPTAGSGDPMNVLGFRDVWASACDVDLASGATVRVPSVPGFTVLKLSAWADRSKVGDHKDGTDLACAMYRYQRSSETHDRLYRRDPEVRHLTRADFDEPLAAVGLLLDDALALLSVPHRHDLRALWRPSGDHEDLLASYLANERLDGWPPRGDARLLAYADAVRATVVAMAPGRPAAPRPTGR